MSENCYLKLTANGTVLEGQSTVTSLDRGKMIECFYFEAGVETARDAQSGMATGRRAHRPVNFRAAVGKHTPLMAKALVENQVIKAEFHFYRPNPAGDGTTQQFYKVVCDQGRISSQKQWLPSTQETATQNLPLMEEVGIVFHSIEWTWTDGGVTHTDTWAAGR